MIYPERKCAYDDCSVVFTPKRKDNIYCGPKCKHLAWSDAGKKSKPMSGATDQPNHQLSVMKDLRPPMQLEPSAQFIIDTLKSYNEGLAKTVNEQAAEIKTLTKEKNDLEKERDKAVGDLNAKPSGLSGFASDPNNIKEFVKDLPVILGGIAEVFKAAKAPGAGQQQIEGAAGEQPHELVQWLATQPEDIQVAFITMVQSINSITDPKQRLEYITYINRSTMNVRGNGTR